MDGRPFRNLFLIAAASLAAIACGNTVKSEKQAAPAFAEPAPPTSEPPAGGSSGGGQVVDGVGFFIKVINTSEVNARLHRTSRSWGYDITFPVTDLATELNTECKVPLGTTGAAADITCIMEIEELDLFFHDLDIQIHVPSSMCSYVRERPYWFYAYEVGRGPSTASHEVLAGGTIVDVNNTLDGEPVCPNFDYTKIGGPNCCFGDFIHTVTTHNSDGTFSVSSSEKSWDGDFGSCLAGPAIKTQTLDGNGLPLATITYVEGTGINKTYTIPAAINQAVGELKVRNNYWAANFYNPSDYGALASPPAFFEKPLAMQNPALFSSPPTESVYRQSAMDNYEILCLDRADDFIARIRMLIREWNSEADFASPAGDPDQTGFDAVTGDEINDRDDWLDLIGMGVDFPAFSM